MEYLEKQFLIKSGSLLSVAKRCGEILCIIILLNSSMVFAGNSSAVYYVKNLAAEINKATNNHNSVQTRAVFEKHFDMEAFTKRCLIDHADEFTSEQWKEITNLFSELLVERIEKKLLTSARQFRWRFVKLDNVDGDLKKVKLEVRIEANDMNVNVFLAKKEMSYSLVDVEVEGALLSRNYRGNFNKIIREHTIAGLLDRMRQKLAKN